MSTQLPQLPKLGIGDLDRLGSASLRIRTDEDVLSWKATPGYQNYLLFLRRLNESVVNHDLLGEIPRGASATILSMCALLDKLDTWIDEIPPLPTPQRFGNLAFRTWGKRLEDNAERVLEDLLPKTLHSCIPLVKPYFVISFGSFTRMDYGTGHEAAFGIFLLCLTLIRFFEPALEEERNLVLVVFTRYFRLCWKLQDVYRLEPAGSHGVWGLDDYSFLGYIFGSGQLRDRFDIPVASVLHPPLTPTNLYNLSISRIHQVKHGPFHEHSSQLYAIATSVPNWGKVNSGLFKMYEAEVLGKRVVVQHIPVGGLLEWNIGGSSSNVDTSSRIQSFDTGTRAPWMDRNPQPLLTPALPSFSAKRSRGGWSSTSLSNRRVDGSFLPPPSPDLSPPNSNAQRSHKTHLNESHATRPMASHLSVTSETMSSMHSPAQLTQTYALTDGISSLTEDSDRAESTRNI